MGRRTVTLAAATTPTTAILGGGGQKRRPARVDFLGDKEKKDYLSDKKFKQSCCYPH